MSGLTELLARVEDAEGPDRRLDLTLATELVPDVLVLRQREDDSGSDPYTYWEYTGSIDDALALVERKLPGAWYVMAKGRMSAKEPLFGCELLFNHDEQLSIADGPTQSLAIIAALLRALISRTPATGGKP